METNIFLLAIFSPVKWFYITKLWKNNFSDDKAIPELGLELAVLFNIKIWHN